MVAAAATFTDAGTLRGAATGVSTAAATGEVPAANNSKGKADIIKIG